MEQTRALDDVASKVIKKYKDAEMARNLYDTKWDECYNMYRFKKKNAVVKGRSNFYIPYAFSNVETVFPRLTAKQPSFLVKPRTPNDVESSEVMKALLEYAWETLDADDVVKRWVKSALIYGTGVVKVTWVKKTKDTSDEEAELDVLGKFKKFIKRDSKKVIYDDPCISNLDIRSVYVDPEAVTAEDAKYIIHKYWATKGELESNPNLQVTDDIVYGATNDQISRGLNETQKTNLSSSNQCEVLEYWEDNKLIVIAGGKTIRDDVNPYKHKKKPFVFFVDQIDDQVIYGIGEVEPIFGVQNELNTLRNQRMDFNNIVLNPVWKIRQGAVSDVNSIKFTPNHKIIHQGDENSVKALDMPTPPHTSYKEEESIRADLQQITGVSDYAKGTEGVSVNDTATGIELIQDAANQRFNAKLRNLESSLAKVGELLRDLYIQYITDEKTIRITEKEGFSFQTFRKGDIKGEYDIVIEKDSTLPSNKSTQRTEGMNMYNVLVANPLIQGSPEALTEITRSLLDVWETPNKEAIMEALGKKLQEIEQQKKEAMMMEQAQVQARQDVDQEDSADEEEAMAQAMVMARIKDEGGMNGRGNS